MLNNSNFNHPEIAENGFGLDCDYSLWAEFNKEILIRNWIKSSRTCKAVRMIKPTDVELDCGTEIERDLAKMAIKELVLAGYLSGTTYLKTNKCYI